MKKLTLPLVTLTALLVSQVALAWVTPPPPSPGGGGRPAPYPGGPGHNPGNPGHNPGHPGYPGRPGPVVPPPPSPPPYYPPAPRPEPRPYPVTERVYADVNQFYQGYSRIDLENLVDLWRFRNTNAVIRAVNIFASTDQGNAELQFCSYEAGCVTSYVNTRWNSSHYFYNLRTTVDRYNGDIELRTVGDVFIQRIEIDIDYYRY